MNNSVPVQLFPTCLINEFYPDAGMSVGKVLAHVGVKVCVPKNQTCCGQPAYNSGYIETARKTARYTIERFANTEGPVIIPSGSCADMTVHSYPKLFEKDREFLPEVLKFTDRCIEFTKFLVDVMGISDIGANLKSVAVYHPSCHLLRNLNIDRQPVELLSKVKNLKIKDLENSEECCGFGGGFSVKYPEISEAIMKRKIKNIRKSGADTVIGCDMGCLMHLEGGMRRSDTAVKVRHIAQILAEGI